MYQQLHWFVIMYMLAFLFKDIEPIIFAVIMFGTALYFYLIRQYSIRIITSLLLFSCLSFHFIPSLSTEENQHDTDQRIISGEIVSAIDHNDSYIRFTLKSQNHQRLEVTYFFDDTKYNLSSFRTGAICELNGSFQDIPTSRNPGQFDYKHYLLTQNIQAQFMINSITESKCEGQSSLHKIHQLRTQLIDKIENIVSPLTSAWLTALLFGDRDLLDEDVIKLFQTWNLSHLLAISGLHVGLLLGIIYFVLLFIFRITIERAQLLLVITLPLYPLLAGGAPSVWRASLLGLLVIILAKVPIRFAGTDILSIVFVLMVLLHPYVIYSLAFQFSFAVTYAILLSRNIINQSKLGYSWILLRISLISMLVILPIQLHHFYQFQPLSILLNLIIIPYFTLFVLPILLLILVISFSTSIVTVLDTLFINVQTYMLTFIQEIDAIMPSAWLIGSFPVKFYLPYYLMLFLFLYFFDINHIRKAFLYGISIVLILFLVSIKPYLTPHGYITVLDIGQGDAIVIELPFRQAVYMIDAGGTMSSDFTSGSDKIFEQVIDPFLKSRGIGEIDAIILSHADHDHIGSVPYLLEAYQINHIITSPYFDDRMLKDYRKINQNFSHITWRAGQSFQLHNQEFYVHLPNRKHDSKNENSLVLSSKFGNKTWLFTGDIGVVGEEELLKQFPSQKINILKISHHGSNTSTSAEFLKIINPQLGLISVGQKNRYNHPHPDVLKRLEDHKTKILRTDQNGAIIYKFSKGSGTVSPYLPYDVVP